MKNVILTWKICGVIIGLCIGVVMIQMGIGAQIDGSKIRSVGTCRAGEIKEARGLANGFFNNLKPEQLVLTLACDGESYISPQSAVIVANIKGTQEFSCRGRMSGIADCVVTRPPNAPK